MRLSKTKTKTNKQTKKQKNKKEANAADDIIPGQLNNHIKQIHLRTAICSHMTGKLTTHQKAKYERNVGTQPRDY